MDVFFIRHGKTAGNLEKRYIGKTDEPLCGQGVAELLEKRDSGAYDEALRAADNNKCAIWRSPMLRCAQTAEIIFPDFEYQVCDDLRECDFGSFENKNWMELSGDSDYQAWIDSGGTLPFPSGESQAGFRKRCIAAYDKIASDAAKNNVSTLIFVVHGGTIMSVMAEYGVPRKDYFEWQIDNACGIRCGWDGAALHLVGYF